MDSLTIGATAEHLPLEGNRLTDDLADRFVAFVDRGAATTRNYLKALKAFFAWMKSAGITEPKREDVISYRSWLQADHEAVTLDPTVPRGWRYQTDRNGEHVRMACKTATVRNYLQAVRMFFAWTDAEGLYPDVAKRIHAPKAAHGTHAKDAFTGEEVVTIEASIEEHAAEKRAAAAVAVKDRAGRMARASEQHLRNRAMFLLAVGAGLRTIELARLNVRDFERRGSRATIRIWGKGHAEADVKRAIAPKVADALTEYLACREHAAGPDPLFSSTGNRAGGKRIATTTISTMLKGAMKDAGFNSERLTAHSLRHTAATIALDVTKDLYAVQKYMRHANPATTEVYLHDHEADQGADLAAKVYDRIHGGKISN